MRTSLTALVLGLLAAGCVSETRYIDSSGRVIDEPDRTVLDDDDVEPLKKEPEPGTYVEVPADVAEPVQTFFDGQGFLLADVVVIHCSWQPYMGRFVTLSKVSHVANAKPGVGKLQGHKLAESYAVRQDYENEDGYVVTITAPTGPQHMEAHVPKITFASRLLPDERKTSGASPSFEIVATERMEIHFDKHPRAKRPSWFRLHAIGTASKKDPTRTRPVSYFNPSRRKKVRGPEMNLRLEIVNVDGRWTAIVEEP
ncbi:MAG: hypothetical protein ACYTDX_03440, partial [Planctomycetota bacterium]